MAELNGKRMFPCPVCTHPREVRITKKKKPYTTCDPCGIQLFVRGPAGIAAFDKLLDRAEGEDLWTRLAEMNAATTSGVLHVDVSSGSNPDKRRRAYSTEAFRDSVVQQETVGRSCHGSRSNENNCCWSAADSSWCRSARFASSRSPRQRRFRHGQFRRGQHLKSNGRSNHLDKQLQTAFEAHGGAQRRLVTVQEAARYLAVSVSTLYGWVWQRRVPFIKMGRALRFDLGDLEIFVEANRQRPR
jgi:excisionase family DNA binding protein